MSALRSLTPAADARASVATPAVPSRQAPLEPLAPPTSGVLKHTANAAAARDGATYATPAADAGAAAADAEFMHARLPNALGDGGAYSDGGDRENCDTRNTQYDCDSDGASVGGDSEVPAPAGKKGRKRKAAAAMPAKQVRKQPNATSQKRARKEAAAARLGSGAKRTRGRARAEHAAARDAASHSDDDTMPLTAARQKACAALEDSD